MPQLQRSSRTSLTQMSTRTHEPTQTSPPAVIPPYAPPSAPLNAKAIAELEKLPLDPRYANKVKQYQKRAIEHLSAAASAANERATDRKNDAAKLQARLKRIEQRQSSQATPSSQQNEDEDAAPNNAEQVRRAKDEWRQEAEYVENLRQRAAEATEKAEQKLRQVIDQTAQIDTRERALQEVSGNVTRGEGRVAPTQSTLGASQFRTQGDRSDEEAGILQDNAAASVLNAVDQKIAQHEAKYAAKSMRTRYAQHNDYVGFKSAIHNAIHEDDGVRLSHFTTWFPNEAGDDEEPAANQALDAPIDDGDSDVEVAREVISTKCPLSMLEMVDPLTAPCNHNYEAANIKDMISKSSEREGGHGSGRRRGAQLGDRVVRCPVPSCERRFTEKELRKDLAVRRKIQRIQVRRRQEEEADEFDDPERSRAISVMDDGSRLSTAAPPVKREPRSSMAPRAFSAIPSELPEEEDEDENMDEDYDEEG